MSWESQAWGHQSRLVTFLAVRDGPAPQPAPYVATCRNVTPQGWSRNRAWWRPHNHSSPRMYSMVPSSTRLSSGSNPFRIPLA